VLADRLGQLRYWQTIGQNYADMVRGSMTASGLVTAGAAWLGASKPVALLMGVGSIGVWFILATAVGWAVWKWRVLHATLESDWRNNPYHAQTIDLLQQIARNTSRSQIGTITANGQTAPIYMGSKP
jgi:hypothetical protein